MQQSQPAGAVPPGARLSGVMGAFERLSAGRWVVWALLALGAARAVMLLLAYPPAHASDSFVFYLYAQRWQGLDLPRLDQVAYPAYSLLILLTYAISPYALIAAQLMMSACLAPLYYLALRKFSPALALVTALVILGDFQSAVLFNFISSEPLYLFLMALALALFLNAAASKRASRLDFLAGAALVVLFLTRSIARYLIVPLALILWLHTRDWRRPLRLLAGFALSAAAYALVSLLALGAVEGFSSQEFFLYGALPVTRPEWVQAENGPNSAQWLAVRETCPSGGYAAMAYCLEQAAGGWDDGIAVMRGATVETALAHLQEYAAIIFQETQHFLSLSGQVYGFDPDLPGDAQCRSPGGGFPFTREAFYGLTWGLALIDATDAQLSRVQAMKDSFERSLCPPLPNVPALREVADAVAARYRSLGRPQPLLWYGALLALAVLLPWGRRYLPVVLAAGSALALHALATALVFGVQPRYVVVTNPLRAVLLVTLAFIAVQSVFNLLRLGYNARRKNQTQAAAGE